MKEIEVIAAYGNERKRVKIVQPHLSGDQYQVIIDNWYQGIVMKQQGEWIGYWNQRSELIADDAAIIGEIIDRQEEE